MARATFAELLTAALEAGVSTEIVDTARKLESHSEGLGATVLRAEIKNVQKKIDHAAKFVNSTGAKTASAFYQAWLNVLTALDAYNEENDATITLDLAAMKHGPAVLQSGSSNPVAALFVSRSKRANNTSTEQPSAGKQTRPADVIALAQYLIGLRKVEPTVYIHIGAAGPERIRKEATLQADGAIVTDEDGTEQGGKTFPDYRAWHGAIFSTGGGGSPAKGVGIVMPDGDMSLEKAVRLTREAGHITTDSSDEDGEDSEDSENGEDDTGDGAESEVPVSAGPPAKSRSGNGRRR